LHVDAPIGRWAGGECASALTIASGGFAIGGTVYNGAETITADTLTADRGSSRISPASKIGTEVQFAP
jgi:hypothetical protein